MPATCACTVTTIYCPGCSRPNPAIRPRLDRCGDHANCSGRPAPRSECGLLFCAACSATSSQGGWRPADFGVAAGPTSQGGSTSQGGPAGQGGSVALGGPTGQEGRGRQRGHADHVRTTSDRSYSPQERSGASDQRYRERPPSRPPGRSRPSRQLSGDQYGSTGGSSPGRETITPTQQPRRSDTMGSANVSVYAQIDAEAAAGAQGTGGRDPPSSIGIARAGTAPSTGGSAIAPRPGQGFAAGTPSRQPHQSGSSASTYVSAYKPLVPAPAGQQLPQQGGSSTYGQFSTQPGGEAATGDAQPRPVARINPEVRLPKRTTEPQSVDQLDLPAQRPLVPRIHTIDPPRRPYTNPAEAHPRAAALRGQGYEEPQDWELYRANPPTQGGPYTHHSATRDSRYQHARQQEPLWPLPLPYEPFQYFIDRQQDYLHRNDQAVMERQFWWREDHDRILRYPEVNRARNEKAATARAQALARRTLAPQPPQQAPAQQAPAQQAPAQQAPAQQAPAQRAHMPLPPARQQPTQYRICAPEQRIRFQYPRQSHAYAPELDALGYYEPELWGWWRSNLPGPSNKESGSFEKRVQQLRETDSESDWPLPLPYESFESFQDRQRAARPSIDHNAIRAQFEWREVNDPNLRATSKAARVREATQKTRAKARGEDVVPGGLGATFFRNPGGGGGDRGGPGGADTGFNEAVA